MATPFKFQLQESPHEVRDWNQHINRPKWVWLQPDLTSLCRLKDLLSRLEMLGIERQTWITPLRITHILTAMFQTFDAWDGGSHTKPRNVKTCGVSLEVVDNPQKSRAIHSRMIFWPGLLAPVSVSLPGELMGIRMVNRMVFGYPSTFDTKNTGDFLPRFPAPETGLELSHLIRGQGGALLILRWPRELSLGPIRFSQVRQVILLNAEEPVIEGNWTQFMDLCCGHSFLSTLSNCTRPKYIGS